jgi:nucleotide-binding universal stress UspA family protein
VFVQIIREVLRNRHDLLIMTASGKTGVKARLLGSTSLQLLRQCPCPVWIVNPARSMRHSRIMAAVDLDTGDEERNQVNTEIMDLATSLARLEDSELHIVYAWPGWEGKYLRKQEMVEEVARRVLAARMRELDELLGSYSLEGLRYQVHLQKGEPGILISRVAARQRVELIVMGTVARTGLAELFFGNTAETVLKHVDCSVLAVKPKGFVSPVEW